MHPNDLKTQSVERTGESFEEWTSCQANSLFVLPHKIHQYTGQKAPIFRTKSHLDLIVASSLASICIKRYPMNSNPPINSLNELRLCFKGGRLTRSMNSKLYCLSSLLSFPPSCPVLFSSPSCPVLSFYILLLSCPLLFSSTVMCFCPLLLLLFFPILLSSAVLSSPYPVLASPS